MAEHDVLVVGGGPVGMAAALALADGGLGVALVEARARRAAPSDPRPIALSHGSRLILERLGVWDALEPATPIQRIHVSQRGGFGRVELAAAEAALPALGYVVDYGRLVGALERALETQGRCRRVQGPVSAIERGPGAATARFEGGAGPGEASARLVALAEGGGLLQAAGVRTRDYRQSVVTTRVTSAQPHRNVAYERFTPEGPLALLPMEDRLALVWTVAPEHARPLCELPEADFLARLQAAFGNRLGRFSGAGPRTAYALALRYAERVAEARVVALGNAAQTLHPVAGQGFNLGLRDAWELAASATRCGPAALGGPEHLAAYSAQRRLDRRGGIGFTDTLVRLFSNDATPLKLARGLGLAALGAAPPLKDFVVRRMTFGTRG